MVEFNRVYESMLGLLNQEAQLSWVENAFEDGSFCADAYDRVREAYAVLCNRLGEKEEDGDLDTLISEMESIQRDLCQRMFYLGYRTGLHKADGKDAV